MDVDRVECVRAIDAAIIRSGLSAKDFARAIGTSPSRLSTYRKGTVAPSAPLLLRAQRTSHALEGAHRRGLLTAPSAAREISAGLREDDDVWAFKMVLQARDHLGWILENLPEVAGAFEASPPSTGSPRWDTLLATVIAHEFETHNHSVPAWCAKPALDTDWILSNPRWNIQAIKDRTPAWLADRGIYLDANDLTTA